MPRSRSGLYLPKDEPDSRQRRIRAVVGRRVTRALEGDTTELLRFLNFHSPRYDRSELIERHRAHGSLSDKAAEEWASWQSVAAMRDLARGIVAAKGDKRSLELRRTFCDSLGWLLDSGPTVLAEYPVVLWTAEQNRRIHEVTRILAPRLLVALWEANSDTQQRLRECRYPECRRPWFVDPSRGRPKLYCRPAHSVRTSERAGPIRAAILKYLRRQRRGTWVSRQQIETAIGPVDVAIYVALALQALVAERHLQLRAVPAGPEETPDVEGHVVLGDTSQYRLA